MTTLTIGHCDLNAAIAAKDTSSHVCHTQICLLAQFAKRITGKPIVGSTLEHVGIEPNHDEYSFRVKGAYHLVELFDTERYFKLRQLLPQEVIVNYPEGNL